MGWSIFFYFELINMQVGLGIFFGWGQVIKFGSNFAQVKICESMNCTCLNFKFFLKKLSISLSSGLKYQEL